MIRPAAPVPLHRLTQDDLLVAYDDSFEEARRSFLAICSEAGVERSQHPIASDEMLCIAHLGRRDSPRKLVVLSGVHGVEGFPGSATQIAFLSRYRGVPLPVHVLLVHVVNPDGMRCFRRNAPGNVDLNRNLVDDHAERAKTDETARTVAGLLSSARLAALPDALWLLWVALRLPRLGGGAKLRQVFAGGQYFDPTSLFYGGAERAAEVTTLLDALREPLEGRRAGEVVFVDLHSGIGAFGQTSLLANGGDAAMAAQLFGTKVVDGHEGEAAIYGTQGDLVRGIKAEFGLEQACAVTFECGTGPAFATLLRLRYENCARHHYPASRRRARRARRRMLRAFCPSSARWRATYVHTANLLLDRAVDHLSRLGPVDV